MAPSIRAAPPLALALALAWAVPAAARTLEVGPGQAYATPSAAAAAAQDGDAVLIAPGTYYDCAVWRASHLTIAGAAGGASVLTDRACDGKAAFVVRGDGVTLRDLTFARIRVADGNGAGVRGEGRDLTVAGSRFVNNQDGILMSGGGFLRVSGCVFSDGGAPEGQTHAVLVGGVDALRIEGSTFETARGGDYVASAAARTELVGSRLADSPALTAPLVAIGGGAIVLTGDTVALRATARPGAILVSGDATLLEVRGNTLLEPEGGVPLVRNWGGVDAVVSDNHVPPGTEAVSDAGSTWHRFRASMAALRDDARATARAARHVVGVVARGVGLIR